MKRKDLRNEADFLPGTLDELVDVRAKVMELGESRRTADGLCMWLLAKARGEKDTTGPDTRSNYRRILRALEQPEPIGGARRRRAPRARATGDAGLVDVDAVSRQTKRVVATGAVAVLLDITGTDGDEADDELVACSGGGEVVELYTRGEQLELVDVGASYTLRKAS